MKLKNFKIKKYTLHILQKIEPCFCLSFDNNNDIN